MTWHTHVASHRPGALPTALVERMTPLFHEMIAIVQCPMTTTTMLSARRKST